MNRLVLKKFDNSEVIYSYYPEGGELHGEVLYDFSKGDTFILQKAENDDTGYFARKALLKLKERIVKKNLPMDFIQAWY
jgi:hypothetical protein